MRWGSKNKIIFMSAHSDKLVYFYTHPGKPVYFLRLPRKACYLISPLYRSENKATRKGKKMFPLRVASTLEEINSFL